MERNPPRSWGGAGGRSEGFNAHMSTRSSYSCPRRCANVCSSVKQEVISGVPLWFIYITINRPVNFRHRCAGGVLRTQCSAPRKIHFRRSRPIADLKAPLAVSRRDLTMGTLEGMQTTSRFIDSTLNRFKIRPPPVAYLLENPPSWWREKHMSEPYPLRNSTPQVSAFWGMRVGAPQGTE